jgi:hypothetical protein
MKRPAIALAILALLLSAAAYADTVVLKNGQAIEGQILDQDDDTLKLEVVFGTMRVPMDKVLRIEKDTPEVIAQREKKMAEEREFTEKMRADGKVLFKGKWITEEQKKAEEAKLAEAKKKRDEERKKAAELAAKRKKEEEEKQKLAEQQRQQQLQQQQQVANAQQNDPRYQRAQRHGLGQAYENSGYLQNNSNRYGSTGTNDFFGGNSNRVLYPQDVINNMRRSGYGGAINNLLRNQGK